ncbi:MAG: hypothetical protein MSE26_01155 [Lachnospiraceae bacterium]|nr:hypothetical protein [Lachnospiraceae bacterium]
MVFKRVLKGIGRLMLTTAVMCGVGLFLCSSEVKAAVPTLAIERGTDDAYTVKFKSLEAKKYTIKNISVKKGDTPLFYLEDTVVDIADVNEDYVIGTFKLLSKCKEKNALSTLDGVLDSSAEISVSCDWTDNSSTPNSGNISSGDAGVAGICKISIPTLGSKYDTDMTYSSSNFVIKAHGLEYEKGTDGYAYEGEPFEVNSCATTDYYVNVFQGNAGNVPDWDSVDSNGASVFKDGTNTTTFSFNAPSPAENVTDLKVQYFPKFNNVWFETTGSTNVYLDDNGRATYNSLKAIFDNNNLNNSSGKDRNIIMRNMVIVPELTNTGSTNIAGYEWSSGGGTPSTTINFGTSTIHALSDINSPGIAKVKAIARKSNGGNDDTPPINSVQTTSSDKYLSLNVYAQPTGIVLQNVPISLIAGGEKKTVKIFKGIEPGGANQDPSSYTASLNVTTSGVLDGNEEFNPSTGEITVKASSTAAAGSNTEVTLMLTDKFNNVVSQSFNVKIISFSKDKTISSINKNNKNYITYNKDKGYSLDIKQLIIDNAKDTSDNAVSITKDQITEVYVGGSSCSDGIWKPSEAAINKEVKCKVNGVQISESDGLKVSAYPMPTATYSSSNRTLSVKIPTKVATAYSDDNNIRQSKGFKLILEDSSGNTLYEYTDSKYQSVLSSSSDSTVSYTVTASDIEGMITSAASNGKFSADTTSVKFKVIPMGYKQSSSSDETIKAKDEIAGKTDAVTVYKVSASGTNFTSSAAYGLDGQTVSITATPNSGYSFKQWSDGNTSNPRQVKVSASGTRSFQAVAGDRVANSTGAGGTDNSELYDDVPKTAESNSAIWLIVFMVFAVMGTTYALYLQLRAANSKHDR